MLDDPDRDNWNDYNMTGEKVSLYDDKLPSRDTGVVLTLNGDILSMITEYDSNKTDSAYAKQLINSLDGMHFDIHAKGKSPREKNFIENCYDKRALRFRLLRSHFFSDNPIELCNRMRLIAKEKEAGNNKTIFDNEMVAITDKLLEYKCITVVE